MLNCVKGGVNIWIATQAVNSSEEVGKAEWKNH